MNTDIEFLFTDTDLFPTEEEENVLELMKKENGYQFILNDHKDKNLLSLAKRGLLGTFSCIDGTYFYVKGEHRNRPITIEFNAYHIKMGRTPDGEVKVITSDEKKKAIIGRNFIAKWIFKKREINDDEHINFLTKFTSRITYILSIPAFIWNEFESEILEPAIQYRILTPIYKMVHCPYCRNEETIRDKYDSTKCSKCHQDVIVR